MLRQCAVIATLMVPAALWADTHTAASCSQVDVQAAINAAAAGDMVVMPAGICTWTNPPNAPYNYHSVCVNKPVSLIGAGQGVTVITDSTEITYNYNPLGIEFASDVNTFTRVSGFTMRHSGVPQDASPAITVQISGTGHPRVRFDHITLDTILRGISVYSTGSGVIDHCAFIGGEVIHVDGDYLGSEWDKPLTMGSDDAWYIENSSCIYASGADGVTDGRNGGRFVFRYNTVLLPTGSKFSGFLVGNHGYESADRSNMSMEVYENIFENDEPTRYCGAIQFRGGTGVVFDNTFRGPHWHEINATNYRSCTGYLSDTGKGMCDGTHPFDGNLDHGWPCRDQIGRSGAMVDGLQTSDPLYQWGNVGDGGATVTISTYDGSTGDCSYMNLYHIKKGRDYFDTTFRPGYIPYPYPHQLTLSDYSGQQRALNLVFDPSAGQVNVTWAAVTGAVRYTIRRNWREVATVNSTSYSATLPEALTVYLVTAYDASGTVLSAEGVRVPSSAGAIPAPRTIASAMRTTVRLHSAGITVTLPTSVRMPELTIVDLAGREVYRTALRPAHGTDGAVYDCAWRTPHGAGTYIAVVKDALRDGNSSVTKIVAVR
jgi:hypothetical protein